MGRKIEIAFLTIVTLVYFFTKVKKSFLLSLHEILFGILICYIMAINFLVHDNDNLFLFFFSILGFVTLYYLVKAFDEIKSNHIHILILFTALVQLIVGGLQGLNIIDSGSAFFPITGTFSNPAPWGCSLALGLIVASFKVLDAKRIEKYFFISFSILFIAGLLFSESRTALFSFFFSILIGVFLKLRKKIKVPFLSAIIVLVIFSTLYGLSKFNLDSVKGRFFIWKNSLDIIKENPLFGVGIENFQTNYMKQQAKYFEKNGQDDPMSELAGNINYALNEYIELTVETGFIGLFFVILLFLLFLKYTKIDLNSKGTLVNLVLILALLTMGLSSYPFRETPLIGIFICIFALLSKNSRVIKSITLQSIFSKVIVAMSALIILWQGINLYSGLVYWQKAKRESFFGDPELLKTNYFKASKVLGTDGYFLYNYGSTMTIYDKQKAVKILSKSLNYFSNHQTYLFLGDAYLDLGNYKEAMSSYTHSNNMVPNKLTPLYKQFLLYEKINELDSASVIAEKIQLKRVKVPSQKANLIKKEINEFLLRYKK